MKAKISQSSLTALKPGQNIADSEIKGFIARRLPSGLVSFGFRYRNGDGRQCWSNLGTFPDITVEQARKLAKSRAGQIADGADPVEAKNDTDGSGNAGERIAAIAENFMRLYVRKNNSEKTVYEVEAIFRRFILPALGRIPIARVKRSAVVRMLDAIEGDVMADRTLAAVRKMFNWHAARADDFNSPIVKGMARTKPAQRARKRILSDDELRDLWRALDLPPEGPRTSPRFAAYVRTIMLTAQRPGEVAALQSGELGRYLGTPVWKIPPKKYKTKIEHWVPLTPAALAMIDDEAERDYVFSDFRGGIRPISGITKSMDRLRARINDMRKAEGRKPMPHWTRHDLRRTGRSLMSRGGRIERDHAERVLGHKIAGVGGNYDCHDYFEEKRDALERLAALVAAITNPPAGNVVPLKTAA